MKGSYPTNPSGTRRSADGPVAVIAPASRKGGAVRRSALASGASEVGAAVFVMSIQRGAPSPEPATVGESRSASGSRAEQPLIDRAEVCTPF
jgi:hypothetical protein